MWEYKRIICDKVRKYCAFGLFFFKKIRKEIKTMKTQKIKKSNNQEEKIMQKLKNKVKKFTKWLKSIKLSQMLIKKPYRKVRLHLNSAYVWGHGGLGQGKLGHGGWRSSEDRINFNNEINHLFRLWGWEVKEPRYSRACHEAFKGKSRLYLFPLEIAGEIEKNLVSEVKNILSHGKTFSHYETDIGEALADMCDGEYKSYLESQKTPIEKHILRRLKRLKISLPVDFLIMDIIDELCEKHKVHRLQERNPLSCNIECGYIIELYDNLIKAEKLDSTA
jgi:hypothetical protein